VPGSGRAPFFRWFETRRLALARRKPCYRQADAVVAALTSAGFAVDLVAPTAAGREETWFIARPRATAGEAA
jgi:hypothetical protein